MLDHMRHGSRKNGQLLAPRRQLEAAGIGEMTSRSLVLVKRGAGRQPRLTDLSH
jgi:hypothetical protein